MSDSNFKTVESSFVGKYDTNIFWRKWLPDGKRKATVIVEHGINEHSGRYMNVVNKLVPDNYAIYAQDHRGHGKSDGRRSHVKRFVDFIDDLRTFFTDIVLKESEDKPIFILGHSMGSIITMNYVRMHPEGLKGMVLSGTGSKNASISPILVFAAKILSVIAPKGSIALPFPEGWHTRNTKVWEEDDKDPLIGQGSSFRLGAELTKWLKKGYKGINEVTLPTLIQYGEADVSFAGQTYLFDRLASKDKTLKMYKDCRHEVYNELDEDREVVLNDLLNWLNDHM